MRKMNSNSFISCLMDHNLICIIKISALTFMPSTGTFDLICYTSVISWNFELGRGSAGNLY